MTKPISRSFLWSFVIACLGGLLAGLGHAPFGLPVCTLIGFALASYLIVTAKGAKQAAILGWALGLGYFGLTLSWLTQPFFVDSARHGWMAPFALFFMAGGLSLLWSGAAALAHRVVGLNMRWLAYSAALALAEWIRAHLFTGFPWGNPGQVWVDTPVAQLAAFIGTRGLGALTVMLASLTMEILRRIRLGEVGVKALSTALIALIALVFWGSFVRVNQPLPAVTDTTIRLVQPNAPQHLKWHPDHALGFVMRQIAFTRAAPEGPPPDLIIWPETAVPTLLEWAGGILPQIIDAAAGTPVLFGIQRGEGLRYYNSLVLLGRDGQIAATYDKHHLVPFGEYIPLGDWLDGFGISAFAAQAGHGYSAGPGARTLELGTAGTVLPLICYEAVFPRDIRAAPKRADWLLHATNDAWFGTFSMPYQHLAQARLRAIEFGLPVVRTANTGISAVIDSQGNVGSSLALGQAGFFDAPLPGAARATFYAYAGDWPLLLLVITLLIAMSVKCRLKGH